MFQDLGEYVFNLTNNISQLLHFKSQSDEAHKNLVDMYKILSQSLGKNSDFSTPSLLQVAECFILFSNFLFCFLLFLDGEIFQ